MNDSPTTAAPVVTVVHRSVPGPSSSDPRNRQVFRRVLDLVSLGYRVRLLPAEAHIPGGAPMALTAAGVVVDEGPREPIASRIMRAAATTAAWYLTDAAPTQAVVEALESVAGPLLVDLDHLRSDELTLGAVALRTGEDEGLATEIRHVRDFEARLLGRAGAVVCASPDTAASVRTLLDEHQPTGPSGTGPLVRVIAPTAGRLLPAPVLGSPKEGGPIDRSAPTYQLEHGPSGLVLSGRFSDEFATPDETVARWIIDNAGDTAPPLSIACEDSVPKLRSSFASSFELIERRDAWPLTIRATAVLDGRPHGVPTTSRRAELAAAGVPFVASSVALGGTELPGAASQLRCDDPHEQLDLLIRLSTDSAFRSTVSTDLRELAASNDPEVTRPGLQSVLSELDLGDDRQWSLSTPSGRSECVSLATSSTEYRDCPDGGTLSDADLRITEMESRMVPLRLLSRDDSINLQSTMDPDQRYRVFARTHLSGGIGTQPPALDGADEITFSILVPTWNTDPALLRECISSVRAQTHRRWELCIVDDGSTETAHIDQLTEWERQDRRIRVQLNAWNQGIALATNDALAMATGDWIVLLDHDDTLKPDALAWVAAYATRCPDYDLWYSDEDKIGLDGRLVMPFFKPDWSPDLLDGVNYLCHLLCVRRTLMDRVGGFRTGFDGAQDYDLVLRLSEQADRIGHISKPLYSWRMVEGSTALDTGSKPKAHHAGHQALVDAMERRFTPAVVEDGASDTTHVIRYSVDPSQLLTILIPTRDRVDLLRACVERLSHATGGIRYELLIVDNNTSDPQTLSYLDDLVAQGHQVVSYPHDFSFARQINLGALHARGDLLLILNNDALARNDDWLVRMMEQAQRPEVGLVGARLMFPEDQRDGRPQHEGIVMGMAGLAYNIDLGGYMGLDQFVRNCSSVTAACVMLRTSVLRALAGMEERLRVAYNDVDFGLRISEMGYRVVYTPHAVLEHPESASRGSLHPTEDELWLIERWGSKGDLREPFINPHFEWMMPIFYRL